MKKYLSLIAIMALMVSYAMAQAPVYTGVPDVKLYAGKSLSAAFDLEAYNTSHPATTWSVVAGTDVATFDIAPSSPSYFGLVEASSTWRTVTFQAANDGGSTTASQIVKYSTYLVKKLGRVALGAADSDSIDVSAIANITGTPSYPGDVSFPPSFDDAAAVSVSTSDITASIDTGTKLLTVSASGAVPGKQYVYVEAGPDVTVTPADYDKGILQVYPNLVLNGKFNAALSDWTTEVYADGTGIGTVSVEAEYLGKSNVYMCAQTSGQKAKVTQVIAVTAG
ncbi:MAG: hypothetical protein QME64_13045, partial [bacterium]|nr:hypothetical protein [bacterium]